MDNKKMWKCLGQGCEKSGKSKNHKTCVKEQTQKVKNYSSANGFVKCSICSDELSSVSNWYKHNQNLHLNDKKKKEKSKNIDINVRSTRKNFPLNQN